MSYAKMMKWNKKHPKGTKQNVISYTSDKPTFTPSLSFLDKYFRYVSLCEAEGTTPLEMETYYQNRLNS